MEKTSNPAQERDPLMWIEAHGDEVLYELLQERRHITETAAQQVGEGLAAVDLQQAIIKASQQRQAIGEQIGTRLILLGYEEDNIR